MERADTLVREGGRLVQVAVDGHDRQMLGRGVAVLREAADATPAGHPFRGQRLTSLCAGLLAQQEMTGDERAADDALGRPVGRGEQFGVPAQHAIADAAGAILVSARG